MKACLVPVYFPSGRDTHDFYRQLDQLRILLAAEADWLPPVEVGSPLPAGADAAVFPQLLGDAYRLVPQLKTIPLPLLVLTSEFGTMSMWDWEIINYLRLEGMDNIIAPNNVDQTRHICRALVVKRQLRQSKFVVYQDNPGEGMQADIFKRFYWWENECIQRMLDRFGITIDRRSFRKLGEAARQIPDTAAQAVWNDWRDRLPLGNVSDRQRNSALRLYLALRHELDADSRIQGMGMNCLNESMFSDTTPCLAWNMLYEERRLIWGCEGDIVSMLTKYILHHSLDVPIMMTNLYPFLMGQAALKHERIASFPAVEQPDNHLLVAHCGYLGVVPQSFATEWALRPKVLAIVDENATAIDARLPEGPMTLAKLHPNFEAITVAEGSLDGYAQYPGSDCLNGGVIRVADGHRLMSRLASHHYLLLTGHQRVAVQMIAPIFGLTVDAL